MFEVDCELTADGGGWTPFYNGTTGGASAFALFSSHALYGPLKGGGDFLRRVPRYLTPGSEFAVSCGPTFLKFTVGEMVLQFLQAAPTPYSYCPAIKLGSGLGSPS